MGLGFRLRNTNLGGQAHTTAAYSAAPSQMKRWASIQHGLPAGLLASRAHSPGGEQASTAERRSNHDERREDQRRGEMPERLPIS
jgi:hypothetical protein